MKTTGIFLKGQHHEILDLRFFSSNNTPWAPDSRAFLNSDVLMKKETMVENLVTLSL
jgi:hypothetical protein